MNSLHKKNQNDFVTIESVIAKIPSSLSFGSAITNDIVQDSGFFDTVAGNPRLLQVLNTIILSTKMELININHLKFFILQIMLNICCFKEVSNFLGSIHLISAFDVLSCQNISRLAWVAHEFQLLMLLENLFDSSSKNEVALLSLYLKILSSYNLQQFQCEIALVC